MGKRSRRRGLTVVERQDMGESLPAGVLADAPNLRIAVGAPVAERAWILPDWFECLAEQTVPIDRLCFVYSQSGDDTYTALVEGANHLPSVPMLGGLRIKQTTLPFYSRDQRQSDPDDQNRALHFSRLRNQLRGLFLKSGADICVSLDTDILLERGDEIEQLIGTLKDGWDVACARTSLHPGSAYAYNAGWFRTNDVGSYSRVFERADNNAVLTRRPPIQIDVPMACFAITRWALGMCKYKPHEIGEDCGFGDSLSAHKCRVAWRTDVPVRHVWSPWHLEHGEAAATAAT